MIDDSRTYTFDRFRLLATRRELLRDGEMIDIGMRAFDVLLALIERRGRLVSKDELMKAVWPGAIVEENTLAAQIAAIRRAINDGRDGSRYIVTVQARGYRFVCPVSEAGDELPSAVPGSLANLADTAAPHAPPAVPLTNLPAQMTTLIGRRNEVRAVQDLLAGRRCVTLTGAGGVGKTRLALQVGSEMSDRFPDGVWLNEFATLTNPVLTAETVAKVCGVAVPSGQDPIDLITLHLKPRRLLLIFDNCEHLVEPAAQLAAQILSRCPEISILATSREALQIPGETSFVLPPLGFPAEADALDGDLALQYDAIRLFVERTRELSVPLELDARNVEAVATICRRLDGIPFAIELAVRWLRLMSPGELAARLVDRFDLLTQGSRTAVAHQQTLKTLIQWSYDLLTEKQRALLRRVAVFSGSWTVEAAAAVASYPPLDRSEILGLVASLLDKSLVATERTASAMRFRLLESTRAFGLDVSRELGEMGGSRRMTEHLVALFVEADSRWATTPTKAWLSGCGPELENLRAALEWAFQPGGNPELGAELAAHSSLFWEEIGLVAERRRWLDMAAAHITDTTPRHVLGRLGLGLGFTGNYGRGQQLDPRLEPIAHFRSLSDPVRLALALRHAAAHAMRPDDVSRAERYLVEAEAILRPLGQSKPLCGVLDMRSAARRFDGDLAGCRALLEKSISMAEALGFARSMEISVTSLADVEFEEGRVDAAIDRARKAVALSRTSGNVRGLAFALANLTGYLVSQGAADEGISTGQEALRLCRLASDELSTVWVLEHLALASAARGEIALAARLAGYGQAYYTANEEDRYGLELANWTALIARLAANLSHSDYEALMAEGATWSADVATEETLLALGNMVNQRA